MLLSSFSFPPSVPASPLLRDCSGKHPLARGRYRALFCVMPVPMCVCRSQTGRLARAAKWSPQVGSVCRIKWKREVMSTSVAYTEKQT